MSKETDKINFNDIFYFIQITQILFRHVAVATFQVLRRHMELLAPV